MCHICGARCIRRRNVFLSLKETRGSRTILCAPLDSYPFIQSIFLCTEPCRIRIRFNLRSNALYYACQRIYNIIMYRQLAGDRVRDTARRRSWEPEVFDDGLLQTSAHNRRNQTARHVYELCISFSPKYLNAACRPSNISSTRR